MSGWKVLIVALGEHAERAEQACRRLAQSWSGSGSPTFAMTHADNLQKEQIAKADALLLFADETFTQSATLWLFDMIEEAGSPLIVLLNRTLASGNFYDHAGALVETWDVPDDRLSALLQGIIHRQQEVKRLKSEASLTQRFQGGLKGQIAKMHAVLQLAAIVQREFLPRDPPSMHGVEFAAMWRPTNYVSGDIYDLIRLDEDHAGVFIADAVGHGVPAALMTMVICRSLVTKEISGNTYRIITPSEVLSHLNGEMIRRQGRTTRFATAVYAVVNCRQRTVQLAGAGHPPPVRLCRNGSSQTLETQGGLLGVFPDEHYDQIEFTLDVGDRLLFYTDGFEQAFPETAADVHRRRVPSTQYRNEFDRLSQLPTAAEMIETISRRLDDQAGSLHQIDDLTMVCMHAGALMQPDGCGDEVEDSVAAGGGAGRLRLAS